VSAHGTRKHSRLGASSADRWTNCPGSVALIEQFPQVPSGPAAEKGTAVHELAEKVFKEGPAASYYIGKKKFNGFDIDEEMAEAAQGYVDYVRLIHNKLNGFGKKKTAELLIEHRFHLKHLHPDLYGTCDSVVMQHFGELHVVDYKNGFEFVEVERNTQIMYYALGALELGDFSKIFLHVVQPNAGEGKPRRWETNKKELVEFGKYLRAKALETQKKNAPLNPGGWCKYCPAAGGCPALHKSSLEAAKSAFAPVVQKNQAITTEQIAKVIQHKKQILGWIESVEEMALQRLLAGEKIAGLKLVRGRGSRKWANETKAEEFLKRELKDGAYTPQKLKSPAQAEKMWSGGGDEIIAPLVESVPGPLQVVHESDHRPEVKDAKADFKQIITVEDF
jgi:hypothetical protein